MRYKVLPNGLVQGGTATYILNASTGTIDYTCTIKIGKWLLSKSYKFSGTYYVDPSVLNTASLSVGKIIQIEELIMRVTSLSSGTAMVSLSVSGKSTQGTAILDTKQPVIALASVDAVVNIIGLRLSIGVRPV